MSDERRERRIDRIIAAIVGDRFSTLPPSELAIHRQIVGEAMDKYQAIAEDYFINGSGDRSKMPVGIMSI